MVLAIVVFSIASVMGLVILVTRARRPPTPPDEQWSFGWVMLMGLLFMTAWTILALLSSFVLMMGGPHSRSPAPYTIMLVLVALWWVLGLGLTVRKILQRSEYVPDNDS